MHTRMGTSIDAILFVLVAGWALMMPYFYMPVLPRFAVGVLLFIPAVLLLRRNGAAFVSALFFAIHSMIAPFVFLWMDRMAFQVPQTYFLPAITLYLALLLLIPSLREHANWARVGKFDRTTLTLGVVLVVGSAIALAVWAHFLAGDLSHFRRWVPNVPLPLLVAYGILFAALNACTEEYLARALLWDGFFAVFGENVHAAIVAQAILFSVWHFGGFPGGPIGMTLVFVWSLFLGTMRVTSGGMLAPIVAHFFADLTIAAIVLFSVVLPN